MNYQCDLIQIFATKYISLKTCVLFVGLLKTVVGLLKTHSLKSKTTGNKFHMKILIPKNRKVKMLAKRLGKHYDLTYLVYFIMLFFYMKNVSAKFLLHCCMIIT